MDELTSFGQLIGRMGETPEGWQVGTLLHAREGKLSELEIYNLSEHNGAYPLPDLSTLKPF